MVAIDAVSPTEAVTSASAAISASATAPAAPPTDTEATVTVADAVFSASAWTVRLAPLRTSPSKPAFVAPATIAVGSITVTVRPPAETPVTEAIALLSAVALTVMAAAGELICAVSPTCAWVSAALVIVAEDEVPDPAKMPMAITIGVAVAVFALEASTRSCVAPVTSPLSVARVAPETRAVGTETPTAKEPAVPTSESAFASLVDPARTQTSPVELTLAAEPVVASVTAVLVTSASATAPPTAPANPKPADSVEAVALFEPVARTLVEVDEVTGALSVARTGAPISASATMTVTETPPTLPPVAEAVAVLRLVSRTLASTRTAPELAMAPVPVVASIAAAEVIFAVAPAPWAPTTDMASTTAVAVAVFSPMAWTVTPVELETEPVSEARVAPVTVAIGTITLMLTPPPPPPGVFAVALLCEPAVTLTVPPVLATAAESVARLSRLFVAFATVPPTARPPTATFGASAVTVWVVSVWTFAPRAPRVAVPPAVALVVPVSLARATAALRAPAPSLIDSA